MLLSGSELNSFIHLTVTTEQSPEVVNLRTKVRTYLCLQVSMTYKRASRDLCQECGNKVKHMQV